MDEHTHAHMHEEVLQQEVQKDELRREPFVPSPTWIRQCCRPIQEPREPKVWPKKKVKEGDDIDNGYGLENRHKHCCHPRWMPQETKWRKEEFLAELQMHKRPATANRHRTQRPQDADTEQAQHQVIDAEKKARRAKTAGFRRQAPWMQGHRPLKGEDEDANLVTTQVSTLNCAKLVTTQNHALVVLTLSFRWCLDLAKDLRSLTLQSPDLKSLSIAVTDPDDGRWEQQHALDLADADKVWFPSLALLSLTALPMPVIRISGSSLPRLKHLAISNTGFLLQRPAHSIVEIGSFAALKILEVKELAVRGMPMDLGALAACSPKLKTLAVTEFWGVGPVQPHSHFLELPSAAVCSIRNSLNTLQLAIEAPQMKELQLLGLRLKGLKLGPGGPAHQAQHAIDKVKGKYPPTNIVLLREVLEEKQIIELERHSKVSSVVFDDDAYEAMKKIQDALIRELTAVKAANEKLQEEASNPCSEVFLEDAPKPKKKKKPRKKVDEMPASEREKQARKHKLESVKSYLD